MRWYSVDCEAPGGGYGESAQLIYDERQLYIRDIKYLDLLFEVWLGGALVQHVDSYCVTVSLWHFLISNAIKGVSARAMTVTPGDQFYLLHPRVILPEFVELIIPRTAFGQLNDRLSLDRTTIPDADIFSGPGLPLVITERVRTLFLVYGVLNVNFEETLVF